MNSLRPFSHVIEPHRISRGFSTHGLRSGAAGSRGAPPMAHVLNVDHFLMSEPTFPPHPHAGFSAVTWMLPWSQGSFVNRDSRGDRSLIAPGTLHWTLAGSGVVHEEIPEKPGVPSEGLQIFVKLPEAEELRAPEAYHLALTDLPTEKQGRSSAAVLLGELAGLRSPVPAHGRTTMAHLSVAGPLRLEVPTGLSGFLLILRGNGRASGSAMDEARAAAPHTATALAGGSLELEGEFDALLAFGDPMPRAPTFRGPFCMFSPERIADAVRRYQGGAMGDLTASPVAWVRPG
jgi:redox-sensitive bicupin YhaK (pirin superfamily)